MQRQINSVFVIFTLLLPLFCGHLIAAPALWQITSKTTSAKSYLYGTVHVGDASMAILPAKVTAALKQTDKVIVEVDISKLTPLEVQQQTMPFFMLAAGQTLQGTLKAKNYQAIKEYLSAKSINIDMFKGMQPWAVMLMITKMEYQKSGFSEQYGIDKQVIAFANQHNMPINPLETIQQQMQIFAKLTPYNDFLVSDTFSQLKDMDQHFGRLMNTWKQGDYLAMEQYYREIFTDSEFGRISEKAMLIDRNNRWISHLTPRLQQESLFIAVGALHLVADQGLIKQLQRQGYTVTQQ